MQSTKLEVVLEVAMTLEIKSTATDVVKRAMQHIEGSVSHINCCNLGGHYDFKTKAAHIKRAELTSSPTADACAPMDMNSIEGQLLKYRLEASKPAPIKFLRDVVPTPANPELTDWYPGDVQPVRPGVYHRNYGDARDECVRYAYWDRKGWRVPVDELAKAQALGAAGALSCRQYDAPWRGLAKQE